MAAMRLATLILLTLVAVLAFFFLHGQGSPEQRFWKWFERNQDSLFDFEKSKEQTFDQLGIEMHKLNPSLTFEFGPKEDGRREFTISADGIRGAFPEVEALYAAAPTLPRWKFVKFRQRRSPYDVSYGGVTVKAASVALQAEPVGDKVNVSIFIPGYSESTKQACTTIAYLLLDQAVGEYDVETRIGEIRIDDISKAPAQTFPLRDFPKIIDRLKNQGD